MKQIHLKNFWKDFQERDTSKAEFNPYRDWKILLVGTFAILLIIVLSSVWFFLRVQTGEQLLGAGDVPATGLDRKNLESATLQYETKAAHFDALMASRTISYTEIPDPSR